MEIKSSNKKRGSIMAKGKMTRSQMFALIYHFAINHEDMRNNEELAEIIAEFSKKECEKLIAKAAKAKASRKSNEVERNEIAKIICAEFLKETDSEALTASEIALALNLSVQKVTPILTKLVEEGIAVRKTFPKRVVKFLAN